MSYGFMGYVGLAKETGWGSGTAATDFVEALTEDLSLTMDYFEHKAIIGSVAQPDDTAGLRRVAGSIKTAAHPVSMGHFLKGALGTKSLTTVVSGFLFTNEFYSTTADFSTEVPTQPYTIEAYLDVTTAVRFSGCVVNNLTLAYDTAGAVMMDVSFIGRGTSVASRQAPTFPSSPAKPFTFDSVSLSLGGVGTALIETLSIEIANNLEGLGALNLTTDIAKIRRTNHQMVNISGTLDFTDMAEFVNFQTLQERGMLVSATRPNSFQLIVSVPRMVYKTFPLNNPGRGRLVVSFTGKGYVHTGSGHAIKVSLTTTSSLY